MKKLLAKIGQFFSGLFNGATKTWNKLEPQVKNAILHGSAIVEVINTNLDKAPDFVFDLIQKKFPDIDKEKLHTGLHQISGALGIAEDISSPDVLTLIQNLQIYLSGLKGKVWANISGTIAKALAAALAPPDTKFAAISALMEFVYHSFIKKEKS